MVRLEAFFVVHHVGKKKNGTYGLVRVYFVHDGGTATKNRYCMILAVASRTRVSRGEDNVVVMRERA